MRRTGGDVTNDFSALDALVDGLLSKSDSVIHTEPPHPIPATHHRNAGGLQWTKSVDDEDGLPIDELVERILAGGDAASTTSLHNSHAHSYTGGGGGDEQDGEGRQSVRGQPQQQQQLHLHHPPPATFAIQPDPRAPVTPSAAAFSISSRSQDAGAARARHRPASHSHSHSQSRGRAEEDALLRRFTLWEERKNAKKLKAVYEALLAEAAECRFQPDRSPDALLSEKVLAGLSSSSRGGRGGPKAVPQRPPLGGGSPLQEAVGDGEEAEGERRLYGSRHRFPEGGTPAASDAVRSVDHDGSSGSRSLVRRKLSPAAWESLMAPSSLYAENKAWGFDEFVARMAAARREKERQEEEEEERKRRLYDPECFTRAPTKPEPFELSCYFKPAAAQRAVPAPSPAKASPVRASVDRAHRQTKGHGMWEGDLRSGSSRPRADQLHAEGDNDNGHDGVDSEDIEVEEVGRHHADAYYYYASRKPSPAAQRRKAEADTFRTLGPAVRQQLLFAEDTTEELEKATHAVKQCFDD